MDRSGEDQPGRLTKALGHQLLEGLLLLPHGDSVGLDLDLGGVELGHAWDLRSLARGDRAAAGKAWET